MIPQTLRLRNFMSYGDDPVEIDFGGFRLACLAGPNGHGKSALLDAITWALWGRSRARRDDDLVRLGAAEMEVEFCFRLDGARYRVLRKRMMKHGGGKPSLELQVSGDGGTYASITGATMIETQSRLTDLLKLGYETFINSSFLLQGHADEFTVKPPAQRKEVLGEILGLGEYDTLAERARERCRLLDARARSLAIEIADLEPEVARREAVSVELARAANDQSAALLEHQSAESDANAARSDRQTLEEKQRRLVDVEKSIAALKTELETLRGRQSASEAIVREADALLAHEDSILASVEELRRTRSLIEDLGERAARVTELQPLEARCRQEIANEAARLRAAAQAAVDEAAAQARVAGGEPALAQQERELAAAEARIPRVEQERSDLALAVQSVHGDVAALESENVRLKAEMEPLRERLRLLNERGASCPVCGAPMSETERQRVYERFKHDGLTLHERLKANEARLAVLKAEQEGLAGRDKDLAATLAGLARQAKDLGRVRQLLEQARASDIAAGAARERAEALRAVLERDDYAQDARARLASAEEAVRAVGYDRAWHDELRAAAVDLAPFEGAAAGLATARARRAAALDAGAAAAADLGRRTAEMRAAEESAHSLRAARAGLPLLEARVLAAETAMLNARRRADELGRQTAAFQQALRVIDDQEARLGAKRAELAETEREAGAFLELARIFGKKGIQAMIIDSALPELERRANDIMARMSDGDMQIWFSTQSPGARGDLLETLDIRIADSRGTRPYEMFSGGEAFRANFAIRVALSRLLTERAGAQLQMLVIDEGFGTQDSQGRERLVEAINAIAGDFEKIVVITHIDELKDLFAARIDVMKDERGSRVTVTTG